MDAEIVVAQIALVQAVAVAVIGGLFAFITKRVEKQAETNHKADMEYRKERDEREKAREERDACLYDLVFSVAGGTEVLLHNAHGDKVNGNVDEALGQLQRAKAECNHVFNKQAAKL